MATHQGLVAFWRSILDELRPIPPVETADGPVLENVLEGDAVDLNAFPVPIWHPRDGGRFISTASLNILRDPDSDWVNVGTYRNQIFERDAMGMYISPGKHGLLMRQRYLDRGRRCPVVVVVGADPLLFMAACAEGIAYGQGELDWAGGVRGAPVEVVRGRHTGLPIPATAEIAIEGWIDPGELHDEGPYGEWMGYYASGAGRTPVIRVAADRLGRLGGRGGGGRPAHGRLPEGRPGARPVRVRVADRAVAGVRADLLLDLRPGARLDHRRDRDVRHLHHRHQHRHRDPPGAGRPDRDGPVVLRE
jgi:3-octaprenyl-4-hydroxybenzoate carboxy-lyase Rift-related domain